MKGVPHSHKVAVQAISTSQGLFVPLLGHHVPYGADHKIPLPTLYPWDRVMQDMDEAVARKEEVRKDAKDAKKKRECELRSEEETEIEAGPSKQ